jgi:hypothetical protein
MLNWLHTQKAQGASRGWPTQERDMTEDEVSSIYRIQSVTSKQFMAYGRCLSCKWTWFPHLPKHISTSKHIIIHYPRYQAVGTRHLLQVR